jgi:hypothetical protein
VKRAHQLGLTGLQATAKACPLHDAAHVCVLCPERYATDPLGFVHPGLLKGRVPLRQCEGCKQMKTRAEWSGPGGDWFKCAECAEKEGKHGNEG